MLCGRGAPGLCAALQVKASAAVDTAFRGSVQLSLFSRFCCFQEESFWCIFSLGYNSAWLRCSQWRADGGGQTGRRPWPSKTGGHAKSEITKIWML